MSWNDHSADQQADDAALDRLALASPLLGATGWIDGLARLVSIDTSATPGSYSGDFADVLQDMFVPLGFSFRRLEVPPSVLPGTATAPRINMIAGRRTGRRVCSIYFHTDTLPAGQGWTRPPFTLTRQGSRLYGRGSADMKGAMAAVWAALRAADAVGLGLGYDPVLLFCTDQDRGLHPGLRYLTAQGLVEGHVMCLNGSAAPRVWTGSCGSVRLTITIDGRQPRPPGSINPIEAAAPLIDRIVAMKAEVEARRSQSPPPESSYAGGRAGLSVSSIQGSVEGMGSPGPCHLTLDRRYAADEDFSAVLAELQAGIVEGARRIPDFQVDTAVTGHCAPVIDPDKGPNWARWKQALSWGFGFAPGSFRHWSGSDASPMGFAQQAGVPEVLLGGLRRPGGDPYGADEYTTVEDVEALARSVLAYLSDVAEVPRY